MNLHASIFHLEDINLCTDTLVLQRRAPAEFLRQTITKVRLIMVILASILSFTSIPIYGADITNGQRLHDENCMQCHTPDIYQREKRIVNNFEELNARVRQCELVNELTWFDEDIDDVVNYININYYMFLIK